MISTKHKKCPLCAQPESPQFSPFCTAFCRNKDLLNWVNEDYRIPVSETFSQDQEEDEIQN